MGYCTGQFKKLTPSQVGGRRKIKKGGRGVNWDGLTFW